MRSELLALVRQLIYPDLINTLSTQEQPNLRGFQDNLIFMNHSKLEIKLYNIPDWKDTTLISSKKNIFEAKIILKCIYYLGQQEYQTDNIIVLTSYLGQLQLLLDKLGKDNNLVLNNLDSYDLVRARLMPTASASLKRPRI